MTRLDSQDSSGLSNRSLVEIFANVHAVPDALREKLVNQGGGSAAFSFQISSHLICPLCSQLPLDEYSDITNGSMRMCCTGT